MNNRIRSIVAGIALAALVATPVAAATSSSGTMTLTVGSAISVSGVPATIDFGTAPLGGGLVDADQFSVNTTANTTATFVTDATNLTNGSGGTVSAADISLSINSGAATPADNVTVASYGAGGGSDSKTYDLSIVIPGNQPAGSYTGTFTVSGS